MKKADITGTDAEGVDEDAWEGKCYAIGVYACGLLGDTLNMERIVDLQLYERGMPGQWPLN